MIWYKLISSSMHDSSRKMLDMETLSDIDSQSAQLLREPYEKTYFDCQCERQSSKNRVRGVFARWGWYLLSGTQSVVIVLLLGSLLATNKDLKTVPGGEPNGLVPECELPSGFHRFEKLITHRSVRSEDIFRSYLRLHGQFHI
jgi:hypothetical protein